jgi:hypothetical protein
MAMAVQQQPNDDDSESVMRRPEEQGTGRRRQPNNNNSEGVWRQPVDKGKQPGFSKSARESASVAKGTLRKLRAMGDREARGESEDSKRAAECLGRGRAQQVAQTMSMEHHLR